jgi:DNA-binding NtrC family response regulator
MSDEIVFKNDRTIGFVDDEESFLDDLKPEVREKLREKAYYSSEIYDAIGWVENNEIDTLVSDYRMSSLDGIQLLSTIRKMNSDIELILLTGFVLNEREVKVCRALEINILFKNEGFENVIENINRIRKSSQKIPHLYENDKNYKSKGNPKKHLKLPTHGDLASEETVNEKIKAEIILPLVNQIVEEFSCINQQNAPIYSEGESRTVKELIDDIKYLTPIGIDHIRLWTNAFTTLKKLGKK